MENEPALVKLWKNYCDNNTYASGISYNQIMETLSQVAELLDF
jgi:hypothetical protein